VSFDATAEESGPTLVCGLGNPILGDDGVGWHVVDALDRRLAAETGLRVALGRLELERSAVGGLSLMERLVGYHRVVLVDAAADGHPAGSVWTGSVTNAGFRAPAHLDSAHDTTLARALEMGDALGAHMPDEILIVTVSVDRLGDFGATLSPGIEAAVEPAVDALVDLLVAARLGDS